MGQAALAYSQLAERRRPLVMETSIPSRFTLRRVPLLRSPSPPLLVLVRWRLITMTVKT